MAAASCQRKYLLKGFDDVLDGRCILFVHELPASVPVCSLCYTVPSEHHYLACGHVYCSPCFSGSVQKNVAFLQCPLDRKNFRPRVVVAPATTGPEELYGLAVYCWNREHGCMHAATLKDMLIHYRSCSCCKVTCSICLSTLFRSDLDSHVQNAHSKRRSSRRHSVAALSSDVAESKDADTNAEKSEHVEASKQPAASVPHVLFEPLSEERFLPFVEGIACATAADVKQHSKSFHMDILSGIALINDRLATLALTANEAFSRPSTIEGCDSGMRSKTNPHQHIFTSED
ncbi:hypothetical protein MTO96_007003 [Rhipicephalus appendiculatus]